jgi:hypothetical protein
MAPFPAGCRPCLRRQKENSVDEALYPGPLRDLPQPSHGSLRSSVLHRAAIGDQSQRLGRDLLARQRVAGVALGGLSLF